MRRDDSTTTSIDALLDICSLKYKPINTSDISEKESVKWNIHCNPGWIVPIPVGYGSISEIYEPGKVKNSRDSELPFCFTLKYGSTVTAPILAFFKCL